MIYVDPPFDLGDTLKGTDDDGNLINKHWEGAIFEFPDFDRTGSGIRSGKTRRSGQSIRAVCVRNTSGGALTVQSLCLKFDLTPSTTVSSQATAETAGREIIGRVDAVSDGANLWCGIGDDQLTDQVASNDLFWLVVGGPVLAKIKASATITFGDVLVSAASGYLGEVASGSDSAVLAEAVNVIGRAIQKSDATNFDGTASSAGDSILIQACVNI
tara:strand:- start:1538 stop:2182 length:645 start_codon:yes stop_codon:yes gene_type:complete